MKKFSKNKIVLFLAFASIFSGKSQAMETKSHQTLAAVGGEATKNKGFVNWVKNHKLGVGIGGVLTATTTAALIFLGVRYLGKKDSGGGPNIGGDPNKGNNPIDNKAITKKDIDDPKKMVKEHNDKIIEGAINEAKKPDNGLPATLNAEDEKQLRADIDKIKKILTSSKEYFENNFGNYFQIEREVAKGKNSKFAVGYKKTDDWEEANKIFSFDSIYNILNGIFSGSVELDDFKFDTYGYTSDGLFIFKFNNDVSIRINFKFDKNLVIAYSTKEFKIRSFEFKMPKDN